MTGGTIVCGFAESPEGRLAAELAHALAARLDLRLVVVHAIDGVPPEAEESLSTRQRQRGAEIALEAIVRELGHGTESRLVIGGRAEVLAAIAAEEGADLIVLGSRSAGLGGRNLRCSLARHLEAETPVPVLVAPPSTRERSTRRLALTQDAVAR